MEDLIKRVEGLGAKFLSGDAVDEDTEQALKLGKKALETALGLFNALENQDAPAFQQYVSQWEDVNRTYAAIASMDTAIEDSKAAIQFKDVLEVIEVVAKIVLTIGAVAL